MPLLKHLVVLGIASLALGGCAGIDSKNPLTTVQSVDLGRYAGTWYEIARLPMWFQRHCVDSKAIYTLQDDGRLRVRNECVTDSGAVAQVDGTAMVIDTSTNARLSVTLDNWASRLVGSSGEGNYWILALDPAYRAAMVGTPNRKYLWIMARSPRLDEPTYIDFVARAKELGFPVSELIRARRASP